MDIINENTRGFKKEMALVSTIRRSNRVIVALGIFIITVYFLLPSKAHSSSSHKEDLLVYDFRQGYDEPSHLTHMDVTGDLVPRDKLYPIDDTHRQGLVHSGSWICIQDSEGKTLVLKRSNHVVTCPNSYSLLGEHALGSETARETLDRGIREEIGVSMLKHIKRIRELPSSPTYYFRDYGAANSNRVDRQVTYLWYVEMDRPGAQLPLYIDNEIARHDWVSDQTLQLWFEEARTQLESTGSTGSHVCHETILSLWGLVKEEVNQIKSEGKTDR